jgi:hypothetical protein
LTATPILDRTQSAPRPEQTRTWRSLLIGAVIGIAVGLLSPRLLPEIESRLDFAGCMVAAYYLVILIHEAGHLCATGLVGFEFREIAIGPFLLSRRASGLRPRFVPGRALAGGHVLAVPTSHQDLRRRFRILLAGGPVATALVFAALAFLPLTLFTWSMWLWNLIVAGSCWIPFYVRGSVTDAKALLLLSRPGREGDWLAAILYIMAIDRQRVSPRDWPAEVVTQLASDGASPPAATARYLALVYALDIGDAARVAAALEDALAASHKLRPDLRRVVFSEATFYQGVMARNTELARAWLKDAREVKGTAAEKGWDAGLLAAVAVAEGREQDAREQARAAIAYLDRWPAESGSVMAARRRLASVISSPAA